MTTTLVAAAHSRGPAENGTDGCSARWGHDGLCPGHETARWLNALGDDDAEFGNTRHTNGEVRMNYLRNNSHVVAVEPELARLVGRRIELKRELGQVESAIARMQQAKRQHA